MVRPQRVRRSRRLHGSRHRAEQLARRVRWLDRRRRALAILGAGLAAPLLVGQIDDVFGADWPRIHAVALTLVAGAVAWIAIEIGLVWLLALWETEHSRLVRDGDLPRARIHRRD